MCGIFACYTYRGKVDPDLCQKKLKILNHRGPDQTRCWLSYTSNVFIGFNRLAIQDPRGINGMQPFYWYNNESTQYVCVCNGEIYNYKELHKKYIPEYEPKSGSDCEIILPLFIKFNGNLEKLCQSLIGEWVILIYDIDHNIMHICSDQLRSRPLFLGTKGTGEDLYIASEIKAIPDKYPVIPFPARSYWSSSDPENFNKYYNFPKPNTILPRPSYKIACKNIRELLTASVKSRLNPDRDYGFLLSGGIDSSLVCSIAQRILRDINPEVKIKTFTVGFIDSLSDEKLPPDVLAARKVAEFIGSDHHEILKNVYEGLDELDSVIYFNESYDETTTRASVPMRIAVKYIKEIYPDICVIFSGEVADELFGSYLYFRKAPSAKAFHKECVRLLSDIHMYDGLRADRVVSSVSCELRLPFFNPELMDYVLRLPAEYRWPVSNDDIEKKILRDAFTDPEDPYLPNEILWRTKDAMSDGVGDLWKETLKDRLRVLVSLERYDNADEIYPFNTPDSQESFYFREIFTSKFKHPTATQLIPYKWLPKFVGDVKDSSATAYFDQLEKVNRFV